MSCSCKNCTCFCGTSCLCSKHCFRSAACIKSKSFQCTLCKLPFYNENTQSAGKVCICFTAHSNVGNRLKEDSSRPSSRLTPSFIGFQPVCFNPTLIPEELSNKDIEHHLNDLNDDSKSVKVASQNHANGTTENVLSYAAVLKSHAEPSNPEVSTCHSDLTLSNSQLVAEENLHQASTENKTLPDKLKPNSMLNSKLSFLDGVDSETSVGYLCKSCHKPLYFNDIPMQRLEANSECNCFLIRSKELCNAKEFTNVPHEPDITATSSMPPSEIIPFTSTSVVNEMNFNAPIPELIGNSNPTANINVPENIVPVPMVVVFRPMYLTSNVLVRNDTPSYASVLGNVGNTTHESTRNSLKDSSHNTNTAEKTKSQNVFYPKLIDTNQKVFYSQCSFNNSACKISNPNIQAPARMSSEYSEAHAHVMPRMIPQSSDKNLELREFKENMCDSCYPHLESKKVAASEVPLLQTFEANVNNVSTVTLNKACTEALEKDSATSNSQTNISSSHLRHFREDAANRTEFVDLESLKESIQYAKAARDEYINYLSSVSTKHLRHTRM